MSKIRIIIDSPGDIPLDVAEQYNILVIPIKFSFDNEKMYRDKMDITSEEFYKTLRNTDCMPKTTQITPLEFEEAFREQAKEYDELIVFTISSKGSGTYQSAVNAKNAVQEDLPVKIHIVDSYSFSYGYGFLALEAAKMLNEGKSVQEILDEVERLKEKSKIYFAVETLEYLKKGGRITTTTAIIGGMLDIRPIIQVKEGLVSAVDKVRGEKKVLPKFIDIMKKEILDAKNAKIYILQSDNFQKTEELSTLIEQEFERSVDGVAQIGPVIGCHAGPGVIGVFFIND